MDERITPLQSLVSPKVDVSSDDDSIVKDTTTGETIRILRRPDPQVVSKQLDELKSKGINSIAIAFVHSYLWGEHERLVADLAREKGFAVSVSGELQPMVRLHSQRQADLRSNSSPEPTRPLPTHISLPSRTDTSSPSRPASKVVWKHSARNCFSCSRTGVCAPGRTFRDCGQSCRDRREGW